MIGKEFDFFKYQSSQNLGWYDNLEKYIGSKCKVLGVHNLSGQQLVRVQVYPTIGKKFAKHFHTEQIKEQIEKNKRDSMSIEDILSEVKQLTSQI